MIPPEIMKSLAAKTESKIILIVLDGIGGLPKNGKTELEQARTPNLNKLAMESDLGQVIPVARGVTPGSGPAHIAIFGYDPFKYDIGRGVLEACGVDVKLTKGDVVARGNFATKTGNVVIDRRAGRIPTEENRRICAKLQEKIHQINDVKVRIYPGMEHRFVLQLTGRGLSPGLADNDPQHENEKILPITPLSPNAKKTAEVVKEFLVRLNQILVEEPMANTALLRGFSSLPDIPSMQEIFSLKPAAIATYPMYRGLARLVGMDVLDCAGTLEGEIECLRKNYDSHDFFYLHVKKTDSAGEDGNFDKKVSVIEDFDSHLPEILRLKPDVIAVTGDHSTPSVLKLHSWHENPLLINSKWCRKISGAKDFSERACAQGCLGTMHAVEVMPLLLAHAQKLKKYGA
jgi:2,3-bisphosphoglycerate-independent phosphoglycerate mutase